MSGVKTIFLDRDGVINRKPPEGDYVKCWEEFEFLPKTKEAIRLLKEAGMLVIIITNQRGIARGLMSESDLQKIHEHMLSELAAVDAHIDAIYYCPHDVEQCDCRKPGIELFLRAKQDFPKIEFTNSIVIGDSWSDMEAGARLGCYNILIADRAHKEKLATKARACGVYIHAIAPTLFDAAQHILAQNKGYNYNSESSLP